MITICVLQFQGSLLQYQFMAYGVLAVVLILLFQQARKLLPTGRKNTFYFGIMVSVNAERKDLLGSGFLDLSQSLEEVN
ncbi:hypothetical protein Tco_0803028 [Tanacetum coccineum]|uniref:ATP synthase F0 subunit 8 n=1 Tax=Tanacetum coccineum TaxID=301880 RepID=A0ABQ5A0F8_9ASTR